VLSFSVITCTSAITEKESGALIEAIKTEDINKIRAVVEQIPDLGVFTLKNLISDSIADEKTAEGMLFDLNIDYHDQGLLQKQIIKFLEKERDQATNAEDRKNRNEVIDDFLKSKGECSGLGVLWSYGKRIAEDALISKTTKPMDDIVFFNKVFRMLILWDGIVEFGKQDKADIERFIANLVLYQKPAFLIFNEGEMQLHLSLVLEDTKRGRPMEVFKENIICDKEMLRVRLNKIIKPKTLIFIGATKRPHGHLMSIYQGADNNILFYDPNSKQGELLIKNYEQLIEALWKASDPANFIHVFGGMDPVDWVLRNLSITVFRFKEDPIYKYPTDQEFNVTAEELLVLFKDKPLLVAISLRNELVKLLFDHLSIKEMMKLFKNDATSPDIKRILVQSVFLPTYLARAKKESPSLARYLLTDQKNILDELLQKDLVNQANLEYLESRAKMSTHDGVSILHELTFSLQSLANRR